MADTDTPKALTAEEIVEYRRAWKAPLLNESPTERSTRYFVLRLFATLDFSRAEAERLRQERDAQDTAFDSLRQRHVAARARIEALEEGLRRIANEADLDGLSGKPGWDCWVANARALLTPVEAPSDVHPQGE